MPDKNKQRRTYKSFRKGLEEQQAMLANAETLARMGVPQDEALDIATRGNGEITTVKGGKGLRAINNAAGYLQHNPLSLWNVAPKAALVAGGLTAAAPLLVGNIGGAATGLTSYLAPIAGGMIGGKAVDSATKAVTGKDFGNYVGNSLGINANAAALANPGYIIGGKGGLKLAKGTNWLGRMTNELPGYINRRDNYILDKPSKEFPIANAPWYAPLEYAVANTDIGKRAIEMAMKTTSNPTPIQNFKVWAGTMLPKRVVNMFPKRITYDWNRYGNPIFYDKPSQILNYLFRGKRKQDGTVPSFGYNEFGDGYYTGVIGSMDNDIIRTVLYGEHPGPGFTEIPTNDYGPHAKYVKEKYPHKHIRVFELPTVDESVTMYNPSDFGKSIVKGHSGDFNFMVNGDSRSYNAAGHLLEELPAKTLPYDLFRRQDIWKFNPRDYINRWKDTMFFDNPKGGLIDFGLHAVDEAINPIIVRTPWRKISNLNIRQPRKPFGVESTAELEARLREVGLLD